MKLSIPSIVVLSTGILLLFSLVAVCLGPTTYNPLLINNILNDPLERGILFDLRLPRVIFAILVGFALSFSGVATQGLFRNPLADPYVLGISGGASVGASLALGFGDANVSFLVVFGGFLGAGMISGALLWLTQTNRWPTHTILLVGIAVNLFCAALLSVILFIANERANVIILWLMGNLGQSDWSQLSLMAGLIAFGGTLLLPQSRHLDLHLLGEETAIALGAYTSKYRSRTILAVALLVSASVCFCGAIGFVGLIVPHAVRLLMGPKHLPLMCVAPIIGSIFLLLCDTAARTVVLPTELPVGIITGLIGAPIFISLLFKEKQG